MQGTEATGLGMAGPVSAGFAGWKKETAPTEAVMSTIDGGEKAILAKVWVCRGRADRVRDGDLRSND